MKKKIIKLKLNVPDSKSYSVELYRTEYIDNKSLAVIGIDAKDHDLFADFSVNFPHSIGLKKNEFYFKTWTENEGFLEQFIEQGIVKKLDSAAFNGFCRVPKVELLIDLPTLPKTRRR